MATANFMQYLTNAADYTLLLNLEQWLSTVLYQCNGGRGKHLDWLYFYRFKTLNTGGQKILLCKKASNVKREKN